MAKQSGLGGNLYVDGYDLSGDVGAINTIKDSGNLLAVTGIDKSAIERIHGLGDGELSFTAFFNDASGMAHEVLSGRGAADHIVTYAVGTTLGKVGVGIVGKQGDYSAVRGADGSVALTVPFHTSDGESLRWGQMLTAGIRTDSEATDGTAVDNGVATSFGADLYLHVFAFTGTDATITVEDSADGSTSWASVASAGAFTQVTSGPTSERLILAADATVKEYLRVSTTTSAGFSDLQFAVIACRRFE